MEGNPLESWAMLESSVLLNDARRTDELWLQERCQNYLWDSSFPWSYHNGSKDTQGHPFHNTGQLVSNCASLWNVHGSNPCSWLWWTGCILETKSIKSRSARVLRLDWARPWLRCARSRDHSHLWSINLRIHNPHSITESSQVLARRTSQDVKPCCAYSQTHCEGKRLRNSNLCSADSLQRLPLTSAWSGTRRYWPKACLQYKRQWICDIHSLESASFSPSQSLH